MQNGKITNRWRKSAAAAAAIAAAVGAAGPSIAGTTAGEVTISVAGSTALKNWLVKNTTTFTDVQPGGQLSINGTLYPSTTNEWADNGGSAFLYQLAPKSYSGPSTVTGQVSDSSTAIRFEFHESGSVEGILEMVSDQISPVSYVTQNVNRDPNPGNAVWVNYNQFGGGNGITANSTVNGYTLGSFYSSGQTFTLGGSATATFVSTPGSSLGPIGTNVNGGQNAVQMATADVIPVQAFENINPNTAGTNPNFNTPWMDTPSDPGYGGGNTNLPNPTTYLGTPNSRQTFQSPTVLDMPAGATSPTGTTFGVGAWNTAGLANLNSQLVGITATEFVANPGTGLSQLNKTDAQFLELTSRLPNGAGFNMTTRNVNSGTRNVAALETGVDPTWASGLNDNGNGNAASGLINTSGTVGQVQIGPGLRFSNKTSGGNELRPTVEANRMAIGTLSINDANTYTGNPTNQGNPNSTQDPIRALSYSNTNTGQTPVYVAPSFFTIQNGTYTIFQNEQFVTLEAPDSNYGTSNPDILGDDSAGDVKSIINNTLSSVSAIEQGTSSFSPASPAAGLESQGYIPPDYMEVQKAYNGGPITVNPNYDASAFASDPEDTNMENSMYNAPPTEIFNGTNSVYGGSSADKTATPGFNGQIPLTSSTNAFGVGAGGNYMFGNFNQNGVRDYDSSVVEALNALTYLEASGYGNSGFSGTNNQTALPASETIGGVVVNLSSALAGMANSAGGTGATKGDLITMGDYLGQGTFTGLDLYEMAVNCSLTDAADRPTETTLSLDPVFTSGTITATATTYGSVIDSTVLNKNVALDYLNANATAQEKQEAQAVLEGTNVPSGAHDLGVQDPISGLEEYTYDPTGANAFNKSDVNRDGVVDFNDAVAVDQFNGESYTNLANQMTATIPTPVTGVPETANLVLMQQVDGEAAIGSADLAVVNTAMTGTGNANWYNGAVLQKSGPGTISWGRTGGTVTVYPSASFEISAGTVNVGGTVDPFTDNNASGATTTAGNHLAVVVDGTGTLAFQQAGMSSTVASLTVNGGARVDVGGETVNVNYGSGMDPIGTIQGYLTDGYNSGWAGGEITSSSVANLNATSSLKYAVGYIDGALPPVNYTGPVPASGTIEIMPTLAGDATLSGTVNFYDFQVVLTNFGKSSQSWDQGDFDYTGTVDFYDFQVVLSNFGQSDGALSSAELVTLSN